ncbi:MAG TPA: tetratricopeptide repeat protein [Bryobacteraceae bacterium]|nr:tetratricopeptide repeat protein [Bryobacteraceae bacterium]
MTESRLHRLFPATLALATLLVFLPALRNDFVNWDDEENFVLNESYRGLGWDQIHWMWTSHVTGHYIPVTWMTLGLDYKIWGMNPRGYHLTNILWHAANAVLFYFLALALFRKAIPEGSAKLRTRIPLGALFAALLFALHPLRVESVAWVTERRDVVSGMFYLLAILAYLRACEETLGKSLQRRYYWGCFALFVLGVLSKEMMVTLPLVLLILDVYPLARLGGGPGRWFDASARRVWLEKVPFFLASLAAGAIVLYIGSHEKIAAPAPVANWFGHLAMPVYGLAFYIWKTIVPLHLAPFYEITPHRMDPNALPFELSLCAVIAVAVTAFLCRRRFPIVPAACLAYAVTLIPVLRIFDSGRQLTADRYSYLACLGWAILVGAAIIFWNDWDRLIVPVACLVIAVFAALTWRQIRIWRDTDTLWTYTIAVEPSYIAYANMGKHLMDRGDYLWAADHLRQAIAMKPDFAAAHLNLGLSLGNLGKLDEAAEEFRAVITIGEMQDLAENDLGAALGKQGKLDEAIFHYREALRINPKNELARYNLDQALAKKER